MSDARSLRRLLKKLARLKDGSGQYRVESAEGSRHRYSFHEQRFAQDYHDENGRLIHAEWDGYLWQLQDARTGEFLGLWDKPDLPAQPGELVFRAPFVKMEDRFRD